MTAPVFTTLTSYHYAKVMDWVTGLIADLTGSAVKILIRIAKWTFGFRKWEDVIAIPQFVKACGLNRQTVIDTIQDLLTLHLIRRVPAGKSYCYSLTLPTDLFVDKSSENAPALIHSEDASVSFFTQNQGVYPQSDEQMVGKSDPQIKDVTSLGNKWNRVVEILTALTDINAAAPGNAYALRNLARWAKRAATLGMNWGDVWTLWRACQRVGRNPIALFLNRLSDDGTLPTGKPPRPVCDTKARFRAELQRAV